LVGSRKRRRFLVAWVATVATWRSARHAPAGRYGRLAVSLAFSFVAAQLLLTTLLDRMDGTIRVGAGLSTFADA